MWLCGMLRIYESSCVKRAVRVCACMGYLCLRECYCNIREGHPCSSRPCVFDGRSRLSVSLSVRDRTASVVLLFWFPPDDKDSSENAVNSETAAAEELKSSVEALSNTLPGTPPELRRRREEEAAASALLAQADGENEMQLPPAAQDISTEEVPAREEQEGVMEG